VHRTQGRRDITKIGDRSLSGKLSWECDPGQLSLASLRVAKSSKSQSAFLKGVGHRHACVRRMDRQNFDSQDCVCVSIVR